jgi:aldehyde:ferredoxin oxidoreductase
LKSKGFMGKILRVDLDTRRVSTEELSDTVVEKYIGGNGLGTKILYEETTNMTEPLGPDNLLIIAVGPVTGTRAFNSDRFDAVTMSPLTGIYAESNAGGYWGGVFKKCGYDALVICGKSAEPVYLSITDKRVEIKNAKSLWGKETFEATEILREMEGKTCRAAVIGPAGEALVRFASVITDGMHGRTLGRCGFGAVMGSKNLKAVVVNGNRPTEIADEEKMASTLKKLGPLMRDQPTALRIGGTSGGVEGSESIGNLPIKNWNQGSWPEGAKKITGMTMVEEALVKRYHCGQCVINCGRVVRAEGGPYEGQEMAGPEYETMGLLGSNCMIDHLRTVLKANELCTRYGLDTISTGSVIGFAMEAFERGLISSQDLDGIELTWGNGPALLKVIDRIARREGFCRVLGEGVRKAAKQIGGNACEFAVEVKGLEPPAHDGRARFTVALGLATANRGACHLGAFTHDFEEGLVIEDLGTPGLPKRFTTEGKAENVFMMQNLMCMFDSLSCCKFGLYGGLTVNPLIDFLNAATGWDLDHTAFFETGERIFNLKRLFNVRVGVSRKDDTLPLRMLTHRRGGGTNELPPLNIMLSEYYQCRGWNEFGIPTRERIRKLGLDNYIPY